MELREQKITVLQQRSVRTVQFSKDEDINVSDYKPDIDRILKVKMKPVIQEKEIIKDKVKAKGRIKVDLLYLPLNDNRPIHNMETSIAIDEEIYIEDLSQGDTVELTCDLQDLQASEINTRKINVKAIGALTVKVNTEVTSNISVDVDNESGIQKHHRTLSCCQLKTSKVIPYKIREEMALKEEQLNILEVLWYETGLHNIKMAATNGGVRFDCKVKVSAFYLGEDSASGIQHFEQILDYGGDVKIEGVSEDDIIDVELKMMSESLSVRPDEDGEERKFLLDLETNIDAKIFKEEQIDYLDDLYSINTALAVDKEDLAYQKFICKNESIYNVKENIVIEDEASSIMQICHIDGELFIDEIEVVDDGLSVDGALNCNILYVPSGESGMENIRGTIPINYKIDISHVNDGSSIHVKPNINDLSCQVIDETNLEVRCQLAMPTLVFEKNEISVIKGIAVSEEKEHTAIAGIVGYLVKENDSLWDIAKEYKVKESDLMTLNNIEDTGIQAGDKLLIVKEI